MECKNNVKMTLYNITLSLIRFLRPCGQEKSFTVLSEAVYQSTKKYLITSILGFN